jgi:hypothetical protein
VDALGERIGSLRIDLPGVGGSPPSAIPLRMSGLARLLAGALERMDLAEVDVLGICSAPRRNRRRHNLNRSRHRTRLPSDGWTKGAVT